MTSTSPGLTPSLRNLERSCSSYAHRRQVVVLAHCSQETSSWSDWQKRQGGSGIDRSLLEEWSAIKVVHGGNAKWNIVCYQSFDCVLGGNTHHLEPAPHSQVRLTGEREKRGKVLVSLKPTHSSATLPASQYASLHIECSCHIQPPIVTQLCRMDLLIACFIAKCQKSS